MVYQSQVENSRTLSISGENIELYKLLKLEGLCHSGGAAKLAISEGLVRVNGEIETRKRKKIVATDVIEFDNTAVTVQREMTEPSSEPGSLVE